MMYNIFNFSYEDAAVVLKQGKIIYFLFMGV